MRIFLYFHRKQNTLGNVDINNPTQSTSGSSNCSTGRSISRILTAQDRKFSNSTFTCKWLYVLNTLLFGLLQLPLTYVFIILQYHTDIKLFRLCQMCIHAPTIDIQNTSNLLTLRLLDSSKDFTEKKYYILYILCFITSFLV